MTDFLVRVREDLKQAVKDGELRRSDLLGDKPAALSRILGDDSLDCVELVMATDEKYSVSLNTVGELIDVLEMDSNAAARDSKR